MRGRPDFNFPAFEKAAKRLRRKGHEVICPAERDLAQGFNPKGLTGFEDLAPYGLDLRDALAQDCWLICNETDAVVVLPGWEKSKGALAEAYLAHALGLPVLEEAEWGGGFNEVRLNGVTVTRG